MSNQNNTPEITEELLFDPTTLETRKKLPFMRVKDTAFVRILPPFGQNHGNKLSHFYAVHWGFSNEQGNKVPLSCSYYTPEKYCPICQFVMEKEELQKRAKEAGEEKKYKELGEIIQTFRVKKFYLYNVLDQESKVQILQLPSTPHQALMELLQDAVNNKKFDPTSPSKGSWFKIDFNKDAPPANMYKVAFKRITKIINGETMDPIDRTPIDQELADLIMNQVRKGEAGPLHDIHNVYPGRTAAELKSYLGGAPVQRKNSGGGSAPAVQSGKDYELDETTTEVTKTQATTTPTAAPTQEAAPQATTPVAPAVVTETKPRAASTNALAEIERLKSVRAKVSGEGQQ